MKNETKIQIFNAEVLKIDRKKSDFPIIEITFITRGTAYGGKDESWTLKAIGERAKEFEGTINPGMICNVTGYLNGDRQLKGYRPECAITEILIVERPRSQKMQDDARHQDTDDDLPF